LIWATKSMGEIAKYKKGKRTEALVKEKPPEMKLAQKTAQWKPLGGKGRGGWGKKRSLKKKREKKKGGPGTY